MKHKYISRIDSNHTHCYFVRILEGRIDGIRKGFSDTIHGGKRAALTAAIEFRDTFLKQFPIDIAEHRKVYSFPSFRSKGYYLQERERETMEPYLAYVAYCYDKFEHVQLEKTFGFVAYGGKKKARQQAIAWRNKTRLEVEKKARQLGIEQPFKRKRHA